VVRKLKTKSVTLVETPKPVLDSVKTNIVCTLDSISREERKREASKPLYLARYE